MMVVSKRSKKRTMKKKTKKLPLQATDSGCSVMAATHHPDARMPKTRLEFDQQLQSKTNVGYQRGTNDANRWHEEQKERAKKDAVIIRDSGNCETMCLSYGTYLHRLISCNASI